MRNIHSRTPALIDTHIRHVNKAPPRMPKITLTEYYAISIADSTKQNVEKLTEQPTTTTTTPLILQRCTKNGLAMTHVVPRSDLQLFLEALQASQRFSRNPRSRSTSASFAPKSAPPHTHAQSRAQSSTKYIHKVHV